MFARARLRCWAQFEVLFRAATRTAQGIGVAPDAHQRAKSTPRPSYRAAANSAIEVAASPVPSPLTAWPTVVVSRQMQTLPRWRSRGVAPGAWADRAGALSMASDLRLDDTLRSIGMHIRWVSSDQRGALMFRRQKSSRAFPSLFSVGVVL